MRGCFANGGDKDSLTKRHFYCNTKIGLPYCRHNRRNVKKSLVNSKNFEEIWLTDIEKKAKETNA